MALTSEQLQLLHDDILTQPALEFINMTPDGDDYIAGYYNAVTVVSLGPVAIDEVLVWAAQADRYQRLKAGIALTDGLGSICEVGLIILNNPQVANFDLTDPTIAGLFDTLVTAEVLTTQDQGDLWGLGQCLISRAQDLLGVAQVTYVEVGKARALP